MSSNWSNTPRNRNSIVRSWTASLQSCTNQRIYTPELRLVVDSKLFSSTSSTSFKSHLSYDWLLPTNTVIITAFLIHIWSLQWTDTASRSLQTVQTLKFLSIHSPPCLASRKQCRPLSLTRISKIVVISTAMELRISKVHPLTLLQHNRYVVCILYRTVFNRRLAPVPSLCSNWTS